MNPLKPLWLRLLPYLGTVLALAAAVAVIDHRGFVRARDQAALANAKAAIVARDLQRTITAAMTISVAEVDSRTAERLAGIDVTNRTIIQPTIRKEIERETRFRDPDAGISDGLFGAINAARRLSGDATAARELEIELPPVEPAGGQDNRDAGQ